MSYMNNNNFAMSVENALKTPSIESFSVNGVKPEVAALPSWNDLMIAFPYVCLGEGKLGSPEFFIDFPAGHSALGISDAGRRQIDKLLLDTNALIANGTLLVDRFGKLSLQREKFMAYDAFYLGHRDAKQLYAEDCHDEALVQQVADRPIGEGIEVDVGFFFTKVTLDRQRAERLTKTLQDLAMETLSKSLPVTAGLVTAAVVTEIANQLGDNGVCIYFVTLNPLFPPQILPRS